MTVPWLARELVIEAADSLDEPTADYFFGAADRQHLMRQNYRAWQRFALAPTYLERPVAVDDAISFRGRTLMSPLVVAPVAFQSLLNPAGEPGLAFAAGVAGFGYTISTRSSRKLEAIAEAFNLGQRIEGHEIEGLRPEYQELLRGLEDHRRGELWLQVYQTQNPAFVRQLLATGARVGVRAAALTIDTPYLGARYRDQVHEFSPMRRLQELLASEDRDGPAFGAGFGPDAIDQVHDLDLPAFFKGCLEHGFDPMLKGVLSLGDLDSIEGFHHVPVVTPWVSNHGGRQSDLLPTTAEALALFAEERPEEEFVVDGGIAHPTDALCALALGARVVALGRVVMAAYAVGGVLGAIEYLLEFRSQLRQQLGILGYRGLGSIPRAFVLPRRLDGCD
ncbi:alpha-hydroxy acid oxidase [Ferrimicrobium sp.]|uniref:alpha-hydroxy acid oxidase n=1 Tax=Ferrimicrobium sp. TaxID=2926050 RepID=UPI0026044B51|nr:alpha-hydroxy acid oxidase [Ferrimicrobium sp.]